MHFFKPSSPPMDFASFLAHEGTDNQGRTLQQIWAYNHGEMESYHDYIQVVFPTNEPSQFNSGPGYLNSPELIASLRANPTVVANMIISANWFLDFLQETNQWHSEFDHNQLRITRVIKSLRLLVSDEKAYDFRDIVYEMLPHNHHVNQRTLQFWQDACPDLTPRPSSPKQYPV